MITKEQLKAWRDAAEKATAGPWYARNRFVSLVEDTNCLGGTLADNGIASCTERDNAAFIAISREAVPALVAEVERLRAALAATKNYLVGGGIKTALAIVRSALGDS